MLVFSLAACNSNDSTSGDGGDEEVTLNFWAFGATNYEELAKEYEKENPNVTIKVRSAEAAEHHDALFTALSAGSGAPDIAALEVDQLDRFKEAQGRFENLYDLGAKDVQDQYLDWKWEAGANQEGDFLIGLPTDIGPKALYYRTDLFEEAGLSVPEDIRLVGCDDIDACRYSAPQLTTVRQNKELLGKLAAHMLHDLTNGKTGLKPVFIDSELIVRESCGSKV